jgi:hypothetical protein
LLKLYFGLAVTLVDAADLAVSTLTAVFTGASASAIADLIELATESAICLARECMVSRFSAAGPHEMIMAANVKEKSSMFFIKQK